MPPAAVSSRARRTAASSSAKISSSSRGRFVEDADHRVARARLDRLTGRITVQRKTLNAKQVGHIALRVDEQRIDVDTDPGATAGVDNVHQFVGWFADWWLRRGRRLTEGTRRRDRHAVTRISLTKQGAEIAGWTLSNPRPQPGCRFADIFQRRTQHLTARPLRMPKRSSAKHHHLQGKLAPDPEDG